MPGLLLVSVGLKKLWRLESLQQGGSLLTVASLNFIAWSYFKELISIVCLTFHVLFFSFKLYLAVLGLGCCAWVFSSCGEQGLLCSWSVVTSLVVKHGLWSAGSAFVAHGLSCSAAYGILVPGTGMETMPPALAGRFFTTGPPGKPFRLFLMRTLMCYWPLRAAWTWKTSASMTAFRGTPNCPGLFVEDLQVGEMWPANANSESWHLEDCVGEDPEVASAGSTAVLDQCGLSGYGAGSCHRFAFPVLAVQFHFITW